VEAGSAEAGAEAGLAKVEGSVSEGSVEEAGSAEAGAEAGLAKVEGSLSEGSVEEAAMEAARVGLVATGTWKTEAPITVPKTTIDQLVH
jgi:hypothetical protein